MMKKGKRKSLPHAKKKRIFKQMKLEFECKKSKQSHKIKKEKKT